MSTIRKVKVSLKSKKNFKVNVESYMSANDVVNDCRNRSAHDYEDMSKEGNVDDPDWYGVDSYDEALDLMKNGYQPTVEKLQEALKSNRLGNGKRISFENNVHGFAPVVPLAMKGVPNSMMNMTMKPIKCKVVDVYYDMGTNCGTSSETIISCGQKLLGTIIELEKQGYRFNLYAMQGYTDSKGGDFLVVKVKSSDKPIDIKRISFPLTHTAFFRVIGFDWQAKSPASEYRGGGRGCALTFTIDDSETKDFAKQVFGENAIYLSCNSIKRKDEDYIKEVLVG